MSCIKRFWGWLFGMSDETPKFSGLPTEKKPDGFQNFSDRMTTGIAMAAGGAAVGMFFGPVGSVVGALVSGVAGFALSGSDKPKTDGDSFSD